MPIAESLHPKIVIDVGRVWCPRSRERTEILAPIKAMKRYDVRYQKKKMADIFEPRRALALRFTDINHVARLVLCGGSRVELAAEMATDFHDGKLYHHFPFELTSAPLPSRSPSNSKRPQFMFGAISLSFEVMLSRREYVCFHVVTTSQRRTFPGHLHKIYIK